MSDTNSKITEQHTNSLAQPEVNAQAAEGEDTVRRSGRTRTLTEKGKGLQEEKLKGVHRRYKLAYEKWKYNAKVAKELMSDEISEEELNKSMDHLQATCADVKAVYEEFCQMQAPDADVRRKVDACVSMSEFMIKRAQQLIEGDAAVNEEQWPDIGSILNSSIPSLKSLYLRSEHNTHLSNLSVKRDDAVAEAAAAKEVLSVLKEQDKEVTELQRLEAEEKLRAAQFEAESLARQQAMQNQLRKLERLEEVKKLNAAKARVKVYDELSDKSEVISLLHNIKQPDKAQTLNASSPPFIPQQAQEPSQPNVQSVPQVPPNLQVQSPDLATALAEAMSANRLPTPEPTVFTGDPIKYNDWKLSFQILIDRKGIPKNEKLYYLRKYLSGAARKAVEGLFLIGTEGAYDTAWKLLEKRFGDPYVIGKSFRDKLHAWPRVSSKDGCELRELADFLQSCEAAIPHIKTLEILNDCTESQKILTKLPDWLVSRWNRKAMKTRQAKAEYPSFKEFVNFLSNEADLACDPISSVQALKSIQNEKPRQTRTETIKAKTLSTNTTQNTVSCVFCKKFGHQLEKCRKFAEMTILDRIKFVQEEKLCFGCLKTGHHSRNCEDKSKCDTCRRRHPTCLHDDNFQKGSSSKKVESDSNKARGTEQIPATATATTNRVAQGNQGSHTSSIVPVWVSSSKQPENEILTYALLDTQSDTTFILDQVAQELNTKKENVCLRLSTMSSVSTVIPCQKLSNLQVRGYDLEKMISLPPLFSREFIPAERSHIPTTETAQKWPHLEPLVHKIPPQLECQVGLLIGYNCHQALLPREILCGEEGHPYGQRTDLGWSIVGCSKPATKFEDAIGVSHRVIVRQVTPAAQPLSQLKDEEHFVCRNQIKEPSPSEIIKMLEMDFTDHSTDNNPVSQKYLLFMSRVKEGIRQKKDGHYELPLQFKKDNPADLASKEASAAQLKDSCWLKGPDFLRQPNLSVKQVIVKVDDTDPELRKAHVHTVKAENTNPLISRHSKFSAWSRAVKAVARLKKCVRRRSGGQVWTDQTTNLKERRKAEFFIIKLTQEEAFADDIKKIKCNGAEKLGKRNKLYQLNAYLDANNILRVGGRLSQSALHHDVKHPAILPRKSHVSDLIVKYHHERVDHQGRGMTMNEIRANGIWILGCGSIVSSHIYKCVQCRRYRRTTEVQLNSPSRNSQMNDIVILKDECTPRNEWKLATVVEAQPGRDGMVRKLKLVLSETSVDKGKPHTRLINLERPIHKIVTLVEAN
nr:uncharacterized protein LOC133608465 [Nerophis lumbriciformis]